MSDVCTPVTNPSAFIFAGKAEFTLQSKATGHHFSYRVTASDDARMFFVAVVSGGSKLYAGIVPADARTEFRSTAKSKLHRTSPPVAALEWFLKHPGHPQVEVHHCGKCGRCGRKLTTPESIARGIGPECFGKLTEHQQTNVIRAAGWNRVMEGEAAYLERLDAQPTEAA